MKILLADDEVRIQKLISGLLEDEGHECVCVEDGTDALEAFENASFDLVILDVMMPRMDGFATCRELRTRGVTVPVIFLSARLCHNIKLIIRAYQVVTFRDMLLSVKHLLR